MLTHTFNPSTHEAEADKSMSLKPAWFTEHVSGQPGLHTQHTQNLSQKKKRKKGRRKKEYFIRASRKETRTAVINICIQFPPIKLMVLFLLGLRPRQNCRVTQSRFPSLGAALSPSQWGFQFSTSSRLLVVLSVLYRRLEWYCLVVLTWFLWWLNNSKHLLCDLPVEYTLWRNVYSDYSSIF